MGGMFFFVFLVFLYVSYRHCQDFWLCIGVCFILKFRDFYLVRGVLGLPR